MGGAPRRGREGPAGPQVLVWELGTAPSGIAHPPFAYGVAQTHMQPPPAPLPSHPSHTHTYTDRLNASTAYFGFQKPLLKSSYLGIGGRVSFWKLTRRQKGLPTYQGNSEPGHIPSCLGAGSLLLPSSPPAVPCHPRAHPQPGLLLKPTAPSCHPSSSVPTAIAFGGRNGGTKLLGARLRHDSGWSGKKSLACKQRT
uniref:Uncharacterized protein n=1 Tax=Pipistrellus kuhlii TaxID=59472 RepID=A0A7J7Y957_PIPKU|nr:hypothetical protein mPipKuh1_010327 [Pipistrellus kuhlii]